MQKTSNILIGLFFVAVLGFIIWGTGGSKVKDEVSTGNGIPAIVGPAKWYKGGENAQVVLTEYSDFQCPGCRSYSGIMKTLNEEFGDDLKIEYKHFPLKQIHPNAMLAGQVAEAAGLQGKFWEMHDKLFENQQLWSEMHNPTETFIGYAEEIGLDVAQFEEDLKSRAVRQSVDEGLAEGLAVGVTYTPYFLLNGERIENPRSPEEFAELIRSALDETGYRMEEGMMDHDNATSTAEGMTGATINIDELPDGTMNFDPI